MILPPTEKPRVAALWELVDGGAGFDVTLDALIADGQAGTFDLAFIDADKPGYITYFDELVPRLRPGGLLLVDNTLWSGGVVDESVTDTNTEAIRAFNRHAAADDRVDTCILPVADGLTLCQRRG